MFKHVIPSQQKYLAKNDLKQGEVRIARDKSMTEKLQVEKRPLYKNLENNNVIPGTYAHTELFQAGIIIEHVESQKQQQTRDIFENAFYMPIFPAKFPGGIEQDKTYTFTTFGK